MANEVHIAEIDMGGCFAQIPVLNRRGRQEAWAGSPDRRVQGENGMLRITVQELAAEQRWILQGRLTRNSVDGLLSSWRSAQEACCTKDRVVDLNDVIVIDKSGEEVLSEMIAEGVRFVADGLYTKHLLKALRERIAHSRVTG